MTPMRPAALALPLLLAASGALAQQAGGPTVNRTVFQTEAIQSVTAVTEVFGRSQNVTAAVVEFAEPLDAEAVTAESFAVDDRTILSVKVTATPDVNAPAEDGPYVVIALDPTDKAGVVFAPGVDDSAEAVVRLAGPVATAGGGTMESDQTGVLSTRLVNLVVDDFRQVRFTDPQTGFSLDYNLYVPEGADPAQPLPMVVFLHDGGVNGTNPRRTLQQGLGAVSFASPEDQARHPAFVLAPQFPVPLTNDASQTSSYVDLIPRLIEEVAAEHPVDRDRITVTGQSQGCMTSIALNVEHPDLFAGTLCVAGQWDPAVVAPLAGANFWAVVSEDDGKAFPGMTAIMEKVEANGATVTRGSLDAKAAKEETAAVVEAARTQGEAQGSHVFFTPFVAGSVLPEGGSDNPGAGHVNTWVYAYDIPTLRDWLLEQRR